MTTTITGDAHPAAWPDRSSRIALGGIRIAVGVLWLTNTRWKTPTDFGKDGGGGLYGFTKAAVDHPVLPPYSWVVEHLVLPNFTAFGWGVLLLEASLGAFLILGMATRFWAIVGALQSLAIGLSVGNAPNEWPWAYVMMIAAHLAIAATAAGRYGGLDGILRPTWSTQRDRVARALVRAS